MEYIQDNQQVPVLKSYDVIVTGGGPAGFGAALAAARGGAGTRLIERFGCLGGMWTSGLVNPLFDYRNKGGIVQELVDRIDALGMNSSSGGMYTFDFETMKLLLDRMTIAAGVDLLFHTLCVAPLMEGDRIAGVIVENKGGRAAYRAKMVIDCTGDGDIAARAGAPFKLGRERDGLCQPMTLMFKIGNLDYVQSYDYPYGNHNELYDLMLRAVDRAGLKDYQFNFVRPCLLRLPGQHAGVMQMTHVRGRCALDPNDLTQAEIEGRERVNDAMTFFRQYLPQFQHAQLEQTGATIGIRETRRISGQYELTLEDLLAGRRFEDGICVCTFGIDIHQPDGNSQEETHKQYRMQPYHIPYRCLVPRKIKNLLVAGRCISGSYEAHASYRVTGDCVAMGQAAGTAAALALGMGIAPDLLDGRRVVSRMTADGALTNGR